MRTMSGFAVLVTSMKKSASCSVSPLAEVTVVPVTSGDPPGIGARRVGTPQFVLGLTLASGGEKPTPERFAGNAPTAATTAGAASGAFGGTFTTPAPESAITRSAVR